MSSQKDNVIRLYDVRPDLALEHLKRSTGLEFNDLPQSLVKLVKHNEAELKKAIESTPPVLFDIVDEPVFKKECSA